MKYDIVDFKESFIERMVLMWRPSKKLAFGQGDIHSFDEDIAFVRNILVKKHTILLAIGSKNDKVLGMIAFTKKTISQLYVDVDSIGNGIGTKLLNIAKEQSSGTLELFTFQRNDIAKSFYEKHGFTEIGS